MSSGPSEELLRALDQSKEDAVSLLDHAALILSLEYDPQTEQHQRNSQTHSESTNGFREQWVLRWIIKRLHGAVQEYDSGDHGDRGQRFIKDGRTWSLLLRLLFTIPEQKVLEILLERNFTKLLTSAGAALLQLHPVNSTVRSITTIQDKDYERPRKRQRLSQLSEAEPNSDLQDSLTGNSSFWLQIIKLIDAWGKLLRPKQQPSSLLSRSVTPAWAESIRDSARFVGTVLEIVRSILSHDPEPTIRKLAASVASEWLQSWHSFSVSNSTVDKKGINKTFNESCLNVCLELYALCSDPQETVANATKKEIERQVALHTVLPLRSAFNVKYATAWGKHREIICWENIEPVMKLLQDQLCSALQVEKVAGHDIISFSDSRWASCLASIAIRLVPKDDVRTRQRETHWLEALTVCLTHLAFPRDMPRMHKDSNNTLQPNEDHLPPIDTSSGRWPDDLLAIIVGEDVRFSAPVKEYIISSVLAWRARPLPLPLLATVVNLDASLFVPGAGGANSTVCLSALLNALAEQKTIHQTEYRIAIRSIIQPVMDAYSQARNLNSLIDTWRPNLEEALRIRASAVFSTDNTPTVLIWDDEDVFAHFTNLCRLHTPASFGLGLLDDTISDLKTMHEESGSKLYIFAKLAMLQSIMNARGKDFLTSDERIRDLNTLMDLLVDALMQQNDYQGQRWRLWSTITSLFNLQPQFDRFDSIAGMIENVCENFHSEQISKIDQLQQSKRSALLMEQYAIFALLIQTYVGTINSDSKKKASVTRVLSMEIKNLSKIIYTNGKEHQTSSVLQPWTKDNFLWNGQMNTLRSVDQLAQGQLACLVNLSLLQDLDSASALKMLSPLEKVLISGHFDSSKTKNQSVMNLIVNFLARFRRDPEQAIQTQYNDSHIPNTDASKEDVTAIPMPQLTHTHLDQLGHKAFASSTRDLRNIDGIAAMLQNEAQSNYLESTVLTGALVLRTNDTELKQDPDLANVFASKTSIKSTPSGCNLVHTVSKLELCMLTLKFQPGIVNQAVVDGLLGDLAVYLSPLAKVEDATDYDPVILFDRLVEIVGILLSRYRRRLTGRTHLLLPVLQSLLRCFFYAPNRTYMYQNAATAKQKQNFRSSLPSWLTKESLPISSAVKFSKILSSICNPTTASARSAHQSRKTKGASSLGLNDETKKAKRIAAQYMQYLIMEYAKCTLDGFIQPETREKLMSGLFSILDAMDRELMKAMNAAMDPSSRAIFKGLYDDWMKHWKWNQN